MTEEDENQEKHWTQEDFGIPHTEGYIRFYLLGFDEYVYDYLGWFNMNDWDEGWKKVWQAAEKSDHKDEAYKLLRHDQMVDLMRNVQGAFELALEEVNPIIADYWAKKEKNT